MSKPIFNNYVLVMFYIHAYLNYNKTGSSLHYLDNSLMLSIQEFRHKNNINAESVQKCMKSNLLQD